jgi:anaerobic carbon-monoxide dehydrogenase iron sulfur subunit
MKREKSMRRIIPREEYCIGCRLCEIHCIVQHSKSKDIIKAFKRETRPVKRVEVEEKGHVTFALQCRHCDEAPCVTACLSGAMQRDPETGVVTNDPERCVGCWTCILVCPFGAVRRDETEGKVVGKCDLCPDLEIPACVANCPNEALILVEG